MTDGVQDKAILSLHAEEERLGALLPDDPALLWQWCLDQDRGTLLDVLACVAGPTVNAVRHKDVPWFSPGERHADALACALKLDMSAWYTPTAKGFFSRVSRKAILAAMEEAKGAPQGPALDEMKKPELAERAERVIAGTNWLPALLRVYATSILHHESEALAEAAE
jgi:ParB family chromosome partitioning protein